MRPLKETLEVQYADPLSTSAKEITMAVDDTIQKTYTIDWITNPTKTKTIETAIFQLLNIKYAKLIPLKDRKALLPELISLAKKHYAR